MNIKLTPKMSFIFKTFSEEIGCNLNELISKNRAIKVVKSRAIFILICLKHGFSYSSIGRFLNRDHTTIIHSARSYENDLKIKAFIESIEYVDFRNLDEIKEKKDRKTNFRIPINHSTYSEVYVTYQAKCAVCGFDEITEVHHILPVKLGGTNDIENLVLLCPNHHRLADRGMLNVKDIPKLSTLST